MNHTIPIYTPSSYHKHIYELCQKIDEIISKAKIREFIIFS